jgi:cobalt/nickel transport system ATP-binding protein
MTIEPGEHVAIVGPNGAGKSTLLLHLNGILEPTAGSVRVGSMAVLPENLPEVRTRVGLVFQDPDDQLFMPTLLEDAAFGPLCHGASRDEAEERARRALLSVGLGEVDAGRAAHHLSGGEKRRAALATVLSLEPGLLALDEPTESLDGRGRRQIAEILRARSQTVIVVTHDVEFAAAVCRRMLLIDRGTLIADRPAADILNDTDLLLEHGLELARWLHDR